MVGVAQLVERRVVVADVAGSSPVTHPMHETAGPDPSPLRLSVFAAHARQPRTDVSNDGHYERKSIRRCKVSEWRLGHRRHCIRTLQGKVSACEFDRIGLKDSTVLADTPVTKTSREGQS